MTEWRTLEEAAEYLKMGRSTVCLPFYTDSIMIVSPISLFKEVYH